MKKLLCLVFLLSCSFGFAKSVKFNDFWNGTVGNMTEALNNAALEATSDSSLAVVNFEAQTYIVKNSLIINVDNVILQGAGKALTIIKRKNTTSNKRMLIVSGDFVTINDMMIDANDSPKSRVSAISMRNSRKLKIINSDIRNGDFGINGFQEAGNVSYIEGLIVETTDFYNFQRCITANRRNDIREDTDGIERIEIKDCTFNPGRGFYRTGIYFDAGNDDTAPGYTEAWDMHNSLITGCTFNRTPSQTIHATRGLHGIAIANMKGMIINNNTFLVGFEDTHSPESLHIEDGCKDILIEENIFNNKGLATIANEITFVGRNGDHPDGERPAVNSNFIIKNNQFIGSSKACISGSGLNDSEIINNSFSGDYINSRRISLFTVVGIGNENVKIDNNVGLNIDSVIDGPRTGNNFVRKEGLDKNGLSIISIITFDPSNIIISLDGNLSNDNIVNQREIIEVYPNPVLDKLIVNVPDNRLKYTLIIRNVIGKVVYLKTIKNNNTIIDDLNLESGMYIVSVLSEKRKRLYSSKIFFE